MSDGDERTHVVLLDACVLVPMRLTMTLLALAEASLFEVLWSESILDEVERNLPKVGLSPDEAARRVNAMRAGFGAAAMVDDFEHLVNEMTCDTKDRHVLAAAVAGGADTLVTFNLKDFPEESTARHGIDVVHPDSFLTQLLVEDTERVLAALDGAAGRLRRPPLTTRDFLAALSALAPIFANQAADAATKQGGPTSPTPALVLADESEALAQFGEPDDLTNPAQVGLLFWNGLRTDLELARTLTYSPPAWGDYQWAIDMLEARSLASKVIAAVDAPRAMAFMRFVPEVAATSKVFADFATQVVVLTLVRLDDGTWRVWGLGPGFPSAREVLGEERASAAQFQIGGGTELVFRWLTELASDEPAVGLIWGMLDDPLRLAMAQSWLLGSGQVNIDDTRRDETAQALSAADGLHPLFAPMYAWLLGHFRHVYSTIDGNPCLTKRDRGRQRRHGTHRRRLRRPIRPPPHRGRSADALVHHPTHWRQRMGHRRQRTPSPRTRLASDRTHPRRTAGRRQLSRASVQPTNRDASGPGPELHSTVGRHKHHLRADQLTQGECSLNDLRVRVIDPAMIH